MIQEKFKKFRSKTNDVDVNQSSSFRQLKATKLERDSNQIELNNIIMEKMTPCVENKIDSSKGSKNEIIDFCEDLSEIHEENNFEDFKEMNLGPKNYFKESTK